jgi:2-amino-4-hydroxy-6-hydroxymethyldihydropteridine diphosphokinase
MSEHRAYVGIGSNLGDRRANVERALLALAQTCSIVSRSSLYRTAPWGRAGQPQFFNAVVLVTTELSPHALLDALQAIEARMGRERVERWGPRTIDLDLLLYDELTIADERLRVPHELLAERAFVLVPLAEIDERFVPMRDALAAQALAGVVRLDGEDSAAMSTQPSSSIAQRVRALADFLTEHGVRRARITRGDDEIEVVARHRRVCVNGRSDERAAADGASAHVDTIKADIVGIFHFSRPAPFEGEQLDGDRELGYIEALGIRTPVHSMGDGRVVAVAAADDSPVEYGQPLFSIARG